jgi:hypothetical protein
MLLQIARDMPAESLFPVSNLTFVLGEDGNFEVWMPERPGIRPS